MVFARLIVDSPHTVRFHRGLCLHHTRRTHRDQHEGSTPSANHYHCWLLLKTSVNNMREHIIRELWWGSQRWAKPWWDRLATIRMKEFERQLHEACIANQTSDSDKRKKPIPIATDIQSFALEMRFQTFRESVNHSKPQIF